LVVLDQEKKKAVDVAVSPKIEEESTNPYVDLESSLKNSANKKK
jgi:hypothetical protein